MTERCGTYLVTAYRWGWTNAHSYVVYCGPDATVADNMAAMEPDDRGGKYGCAVDKYEPDGGEACQKVTRIAYYPSAYDEERPFRNWRIDYFESLGHVLEEYMDGHVWIQELGETVLTPTKIDHPIDEMLHQAVKRKRDFYAAMADQSKENQP